MEMFLAALGLCSVKEIENKKENSAKPKSKQKNLFCRICKTFFKNKRQKVTHMTKHFGVRDIKIFNKPKTLLKEPNSNTISNSIHQCGVCPKEFQSKAGLKAHALTHSTDKKAFQCPKCDKTFKQNCELNSHLVCHSNDYNFACNLCEKRFKRKRNLTQHLRTNVHKQN